MENASKVLGGLLLLALGLALLALYVVTGAALLWYAFTLDLPGLATFFVAVAGVAMVYKSLYAVVKFVYDLGKGSR